MAAEFGLGYCWKTTWAVFPTLFYAIDIYRAPWLGPNKMLLKVMQMASSRVENSA